MQLQPVTWLQTAPVLHAQCKLARWKTLAAIQQLEWHSSLKCVGLCKQPAGSGSWTKHTRSFVTVNVGGLHCLPCLLRSQARVPTCSRAAVPAPRCMRILLALLESAVAVCAVATFLTFPPSLPDRKRLHCTVYALRCRLNAAAAAISRSRSSKHLRALCWQRRAVLSSSAAAR